LNDDSSPAPSGPSVHRISGWRFVVLLPLGILVRLWSRTLRFEIPDEDRRTFERGDRPVAFVVWHNRLFLVPEYHRRYRGGRPVYGLVSASKDGAWLAAFFSLVGMRAVRGSSSRLAREGAQALVSVLRAGHDVGITPDGPRGPCYDLKPGALIVARRTGAPLLLLGGDFVSAWRLGSWDGFYLPRPFSTVRVRCIEFPAEALSERDEAAAAIAARMREINPDR
jgi:lysophospholipid acyltransferase (LPLAT)-like uncharacterized protein